MDNDGKSSRNLSKDEARTYILNLLKAGDSPEQISESLSIMLKAPRSLVNQFVDQVTAEYNLTIAAKSETAPVPPDLQVGQSSELGSVHQRQTGPVIIPAKPDDVSSGIARLLEDPQPDTVAAFFLSGSTETKTDPVEQDSDLSAPTKTEPRELSPAEQKEVEEYILRELKKQRKQNDVIMGVCQITGLHWRHAQKLVAMVMVHNQKKLVTSQNMVIIPLAVIVTLAGIILVLASVNEMLVIKDLLIDPSTVTPEQVNGLSETGRQVLWAFGVGVVLGLGGMIGLFMAIKKQLSVN